MKTDKLTIIIFGLFALLGLWVFLLSEPLTIADYNTTYLVNATVNITNSAPLGTSIALDPVIDLVAYNTSTVYCNISTLDYDNDTLTVNATLYLESISNPLDTDHGNYHYTNTSCRNVTSQNDYMNWTCAFQVEYYAFNSTIWRCNATFRDALGASTNNQSGYATVNTLVALKMPDLLDYGNLQAQQVSNDTLGNITNAGNRHINISVEGWGTTPGDGLAFDCTTGSIPLSYERYNTTANSTYQYMTQLTGSAVNISDFYVPRRTSISQDSVNYTYWRIEIPAGVAGVCNGKILFTASDGRFLI